MTHTLPLIHYIPTKGWNKPFHARSQLRKVLLRFQPELVLLEYSDQSKTRPSMLEDNTWQWTKCGASQSDVRRSSKYDNGLTLWWTDILKTLFKEVQCYIATVKSSLQSLFINGKTWV